MKATTQATTEITAAAIYRCTNKVTKEVFYMVKSDSSDAWYQVRFDTRRAAWTCQCPSKHPCKHERAVQDVLKIRRTRIATQMGGNVPAIVAMMQAEEDKRIVLMEAENVASEREKDIEIEAGLPAQTISERAEQQRRTAELNGYRAFSLLRS